MSNTRDTIGEIHNYGIDVKNREIYLHSAKDGGEEDPGVDYRMAINFVKNIRHLDSLNSDEIKINMQSIGGSWQSGMSIYDAIKSCKSYVTIVTYGQAESMSGIILQAADNRLMSPHSHFMAHFGSTDCSGDYLSAQKWAELDKQNLDVMLDIFATKCQNTGKYFKERKYSVSKTKAYIKRKMKDGDWYLTSSEAVQFGFADGVIQ
jgi:ATP-dependent protease ClpP protease subunit|tara:strand:- start:16680 stop:17297 length:618 start_codon:yes stop_codon:yes gene_type:complete